MEKSISYQIELIEQYLGSIHAIESKIIDEIESIVPEVIVSNSKEPKIPLDMKLLQQRIDSVSIIRYYKDLKNERLRDDNVKLENDIDDVFNAVQASAENKPWARLDMYTKKKKIESFVDKLIELNKVDDKQKVIDELNEMLQSKRISKKNIEFDSSNSIIRLAEYNLL